MERLTEYRVQKGGIRRKYPCFSPDIIPDDNCPPFFCEKAKKCNFVHISSRKCPYLQVIDRLAAYEDTGLEPEEIESIKSLCLGGEHYVLGFLPPPNDPLTLEELREMDGEPVYDWMGYEWFVVSEVTDDEVIMTDGTVFDIDEDSVNSAVGRFYRRKPEEGEL